MGRVKQSAVTAKFMNKPLFKVGIIGSVIAALCCFTPILVILFGALGISALVGYLDYVLFPLLGLFLLVMVVALVTKRGSAT
jgi:mercuric ion transport protein